MSAETLLAIEGITKSFGSARILKGISLDVRRGEFLTLLGPSGCGKTTTLRVVAGFERPDSGRVRLLGQDVTDLPPYERNVHTVFQHYALFPHYDVYENVAFGLRLQKLPESEIRSRAAEALALVKLEGFESRRVTQLSGGQMQRIALARALVGRPQLLLLDEPLGALDLKLRKAMQLELKAIQRRLGLAFVYVTHDQEEALTMSDRIAVFNAGEIVQLDTPEAIYERPDTSFVADFIGSANILSARLVKVESGRITLSLEDELTVELPRPPKLPVREGERLRVAIRPERILVRYEAPGVLETAAGRVQGLLTAADTITVPAKLKESIYLGDAFQLFLSLFRRSRKDVMAASMDTTHQERRAPGAPVWAEIRAKDILLLEPEISLNGAAH